MKATAVAMLVGMMLGAGVSEEKFEHVSLIKLIATPEKYEGRL
jgi:hypothetical protein